MATDEGFLVDPSNVERHQMLLRSLDEEIRQYPDRADAYFRRGYFRIHPARDDDEAALDAAMADFSRTVALDPEHLNARFWRGCVADRKKDRAAAIADYSWVIDHHPGRVGALIYRGKALMNQGEFDRAIADFDRADGRPGVDQTSVWMYRAWCHAAKGRHDRAIADYSKAIEGAVVVPPWVYVGRATSYHTTGVYEKALADLDKALSLQPGDSSAHYLRAEIRMAIGDFSAVAGEAEELTRLLPNQAGPYFLLSVASWLAACERDRDLAVIIQYAAWAERILPCAPAPGLVSQMAAAMIGTGRKQALAALDQFLALEPRLSFPYAIRAIFNAHEGRFLPTCRDLAFFVARFRRQNYHLLASIDRQNRRFTIGLFEVAPPSKGATGPKKLLADIGGKCMYLFFERWPASGFSLKRWAPIAGRVPRSHRAAS